MTAFFKPLSRFAAMAAALAICGGHSAVLQSFAWTTMLVNYSHGASFGEAFVKTFDGRHPCPLCKSIAKNTQSERAQGAKNVSARHDLFLHSAALVVARPDHYWEYALRAAAARPRAEPPPVPPPRITAGASLRLI